MISLYLAGPMTGHPDWNYPLFHQVAAELRATGACVVSPAEQHDPVADPRTWEFYMREGLRAMLCCDQVVVLQGWERSRGANLEVLVANRLGLDVYEYAPGGYPLGRRITAGRGGENV